MSAPKQPIPLRSPDGRVYTYACGQCRHVCGTGTRLCEYDDETVDGFAESSRHAAARCCACRGCGGLVDDKWSAFCRPDFGFCARCGPAEIERVRLATEALAATLPRVEVPSRCPMCGALEDE